MAQATSEIETVVNRVVSEMCNALVPLLKIVDGPFREFTIPVGAETTANVRFNGPITVAELDALIAQITTYKELMGERKRLTPEELRKMMVEAATKAVADSAAA